MYGGGMLNHGSSPTVTDCTFSGNSGTHGGGMHNFLASPTLTNCAFSGNHATHGGGMHNDHSSPTIANCTFSGNTATGAGNGGGAIHNASNSSPTVTNCTFSGNTAFNGGGIYNTSTSPSTVTNCTFSGNTASNAGGGIYSASTSLPAVTNCIFWGNSGDQIFCNVPSFTVSYCCVQDGYSGEGNIDRDPQFVDADGADDTYGTADDDVHLLPTSPCIDAGDNSAPGLPATDFEGRNRRIDHPGVPDTGNGTAPIVDMGVHEVKYTVLYVDDSATAGSDNGTSWTDAYLDLQSALDDTATADWGEIHVAEGTYKPSVQVGGTGSRYATFQLQNGVTLYGGYPNGGGTRAPDTYTSTLSGDIDTDGDDDCYHVFYHPRGIHLDATAVLDGFTITAGNADGSHPHNIGGGMHNSYASSPTLTDCTFSGNTAGYGGGMYNADRSSPTVTNCTFCGNRADHYGGMYNYWFSSPTVTDCTFSGNTAYYGGGMRNGTHSSPTVTNCTFSGNTATYRAGGMYNHWYSSPTVTNCTFSGNTAGTNGGGMYNDDDCSPTVTNCTFSGNAAPDGGGMLSDDSSPTVTNCIFWGNTIGQISDTGTSAPTVSYCCVQDGYAGETDIIDADPEFVDADGADDTYGTADDDVHLQPTSPCIDEGDNSAPNLPATDFEGDDRIIGGIVDIGVDEHRPPPNGPPTAVTVTPNPASLAENTDTTSSVKVGDIAIDDDGLGTNTLSLSGGADANSFTIAATELHVAAGVSLDYERRSTYAVIVQVDDVTVGLTPDATTLFTLNVTDVNEPPTDIALYPDVVPEGTDTTGGYAMGILSGTDPDTTAPNNTLTFSIQGGADSAKFSVDGSSNLVLTDGVLELDNPTDANADGVYEVTVRVTDGGTPGLTYDEAFTVTIIDVNDTPTDIALSADTVAENTDTSGGHVVGGLTGTDPDPTAPNNTLTFSILGGVDGAKFSVDGSNNLVLTDGVLDFESPTDADANGVYDVTLRVTDGGTPGLTYDEAFTVTVTDVDEAPTDIALSADVVAENTDTSGGHAVGALSGTDPDTTAPNNTLTFSILSGADAAKFTVDGANNLVLTDGVLDLDNPTDANADGVYEVTVQATDGGTPGLTYDEAFTVTVTDTSNLSIVAASADHPEGDRGTTGFTFTVRRTGVTSGAVGASWAVTGSETNPADGADFVGGALPSGPVSFGDGDATDQTVTVTVQGDQTVEPDEGFTVTLSNPTGDAEIHGSPASGTIRDDDAQTELTLVAGSLIVTDALGGDSDDTLTIQSDTANDRFIIHDPHLNLVTSIAGATGSGTHTVTIPFSQVTGSQITVNTLGGDDSLTVDYSLGNFAEAIAYNAGANSAAGDSLTLEGGGPFATAAFGFTNESDGSVTLSGNATLTYTGLKPIAAKVTATDLTLNYSTADDAITISDPGTPGKTAADSDAGESITFNNPGGTLTVNGGEGDDAIDLAGLGSGFAANLVIDTQAGTADTIRVTGGLRTGGGDVSLTAANGVTLEEPVATAGGSFSVDADRNDNGTGAFTVSATALAGFGERSTLAASDAAAGDQFGCSVSVSGDTALVGANYDDDYGPNSGAAYVFTGSGGNWTQQAQLTAADASVGDQFGGAVSIYGDTAVVGAPLDDDAGVSSGSAYVFTRSGDTWTQQAKLVAADAAAHDWFGCAVSVSGDTAVVGAEYDDDVVGDHSGAAYVFTRSGGAWTQQAKLTADDAVANEWFGHSVAVSGDTAVVGAHGHGGAGSSSGSAYVFTRSGTTWTQQARLTGADTDAYDYFGRSVSVSGDTAVVGADGHDSTGAAYAFTRSGGAWTQQAKLAAADSEFGCSVSVSGDTAVIGAQDGHGAAYVFTRSGSTWTQQAKVVAVNAAAGDRFGCSVSVIGNTALVGADGNDDAGEDSGSAYVFESAPGSVTTSGGYLTVTAADVALEGAISAGGGTVRFLGSTANRTFDLGATGGAGLVVLTDAELDYVATTDRIVVGDATAGNVTFTGTVGLANTNALQVVTAGYVTQTVAGFAVSGDTLLIDGQLVPGLAGAFDVDGPVTFDSTASFAVDLGGTTAGTEHDQLTVAGASRTVVLNNATLSVSVGYSPAEGDQFVIIDNQDSGSSVSGTFNGLPEGAVLVANGHHLHLTYRGGADGNDMVLTANSAPTDIALSPDSVAENQPAGTVVGTLSATDPDAGDTHTYTLVSGAGDYDSFQIAGNTVRTAASFDYETKSSYTIRVQADDGHGGTYWENIPISIEDVNEPPSVALENTISSLSEHADTTSPIRVADIVVTDDALGAETLSVSGADAVLFEIVGAELLLRAGASLNHETNPQLDVTVAVEDPTVGASPDDTTSLAIPVSDGANLSIAAASADSDEGNAAPTAFTFTVSRTGSMSGTVSASWVVTGSGTDPADGADFVGGALPSGTVSFGDGDATKTVTVAVQGDQDVEPDEGFRVCLSSPSPGAEIHTDCAEGTIRNDDCVAHPPLSLSPPPGSTLAVAEGDPVGTTFTVQLDNEPCAPVTVTLAMDGTSDSDFAVSPLFMVFDTINWDIARTANVTAAEDFDACVGLGTVNVTLNGTTETLNTEEIENDTQAIVASPDRVTVTEGGTAMFAVQLQYQPCATVSVAVGMAGSDADLTAAPAILEFTAADWNTPKSVTVTAGEDNDVLDGSDTVQLTAAGLNPVNVAATEEDDDHTLTVLAGPGGSTDPSGSSVREGDPAEEVEIKPEPEAGYYFVKWTGDVPDGHETDNPLMITMDADKTLTANFGDLLGPNYYVNDDSTKHDFWCTAPGDPSNDGLSPDTPKDSIQGILDAYILEAGDVVHVDTGTYRLSAPIRIEAGDGGTADDPVRFIGSPAPRGSRLVKEKQAPGFDGYLRVQSATGVSLESLILEGPDGWGAWGCHISSSSDVTILGNVISSFDHVGINVVGSSNVSIRGNVVRDGESDAVRLAASCTQVTIEQNWLYGNSKGLSADGARNTDVVNNFVFANSQAGIEVRYPGDNVQLLHNTLHANGRELVVQGGGGSVSIANNILWAEGEAAVCLDIDELSRSAVLSDYNDLYAPGAAAVGRWGAVTCGSLASWQATTGQDAHSLTVDPACEDTAAVDLTDRDYHLTAQSPVIDAGTVSPFQTDPTDRVETDIDGQARPAGAGPDLGADERMAAPKIRVKPKKLKFKTPVGTPQEKLLRIQNKGDATLVVESIASSNPAFSVVPSDFSAVIEPGKKARVTVRFTPLAQGKTSSWLLVLSNDPTRPRLTMKVKGNGKP